jgi:hypothetical protein
MQWFYYAPNTYKELKVFERRKFGVPVRRCTHAHV